MEPGHTERVPWIGWLFTILIWPMLAAGPVSNVASRVWKEHANLALIVIWVAMVGLASIGQARRVAAQREIRGCWRSVVVWLVVTSLGCIIVVTISFAACAILSGR